MKTLPVMVIVCVVMTLTGADAPPEEKSSDIQTGKSRLIKRSLRCPGWSEYKGRCFLYVPRPMTWARAEKNCQSQGGNLASIHDVYEQREIQRMIVNITDDYPVTWIGGTDAPEGGFWLWIDGRPFHYSNWCSGQPDNFLFRQSCIQMNYGGSRCWDDEYCYFLRPSVCAKKIE